MKNSLERWKTQEREQVFPIGVERSQVEREKAVVESKLAKVTDELGMTKSKLFIQTDQKASTDKAYGQLQLDFDNAQMNQRELELELAALREELEVKESFIMASQKPDTGTQFTRQDSLNSSQVQSSSGHYLSNYTDGRQRGDLKEKLGEILGNSGVQSGRQKASSGFGKELALEVKGSGVIGVSKDRPYDGTTVDLGNTEGRTEDIKNKLPESQKKLMNEIMQDNLGGFDLEAPDQVSFFLGWESKFFRGVNLAVG